MSSITITATELTKRFSGKPIFSPLSFSVAPGEILAITGQNGSGKSTLLKMLAHVLTPSKGTCVWTTKEGKVREETSQHHVGFLAPYLELYSELTAVEHVRMVAEWKQSAVGVDEAMMLLERCGLGENAVRSDLPLRAFSSGMKQRVRFALALVANPGLLFMDEPTSNLDQQGTAMLLAELRSRAAAGATVVLATNEEREVAIATRTLEVVPLR